MSYQSITQNIAAACSRICSPVWGLAWEVTSRCSRFVLILFAGPASTPPLSLKGTLSFLSYPFGLPLISCHSRHLLSDAHSQGVMPGVDDDAIKKMEVRRTCSELVSFHYHQVCSPRVTSCACNNYSLDAFPKHTASQEGSRWHGRQGHVSVRVNIRYRDCLSQSLYILTHSSCLFSLELSLVRCPS